MSRKPIRESSKFLSYILRHHPEAIGLEVDARGWAQISSLVEKARSHGRSLSRKHITEIIEHGEKKRFELSEDQKYIRAGYGHSIDVDLELEPRQPPSRLFHGTASRNVESIRQKGLHSGSRNLVHLSANRHDAVEVGSRHGKPQVLTIKSGIMYEQAIPFYQSESEPDIWLVESVPAQFIEL